MSATNPENGMVTYTYNANGLVATRTDAKNQQTQYSYDGFNRVTQIRHYGVAGGGEDTCQQVNFYYDSNPYVSGYSTYVAGRLAARTYQAANCGQAGNAFTEMFSYTPAGQVTKKLLRVWRVVSGQLLWADLDSSYGYDNEGKLTSVTYPRALDGSNNVVGGATYTYGYDSMARLYSLTNSTGGSPYITSATYGPGGELLSLAGTINETRTYNARLQLTRLSAPHQTCTYWTCTNDGVDYTYTYSASQNNGRIIQQTDNSSGEQVTYQYDELNRLISAVTADNPSVPQWGQAFLYDGFGNLTDKSVIKGSAPVWHGLVDPASNRASGYTYDANGNASSPSLQNSFDIENRIVSQTAWVQSSQYLYGYGYDPDNRRIYKATSTYDPGSGGFTLTNEEVTFWSPTGQRMGTYLLLVNPGGGGYAPSLSFRWTNSERVYFGNRLIWRGGAAVYTDRLGSVGKYFPYGEDRPAATVGDGEKFATYYRDGATGLDYADQRFYSNTMGRFMTPDPSGDAWDPANPGSWNSYAYVLGDPINLNDPSGLVQCGDLNVIGGGTLSDYINASGDAGKLTRFVWAEGGTLAASGGSQAALGLSMAYIAQAIENRLDIANGRVAVGGIDGNIYWGNGGTFNGVATLAASILGYGGVGTTLSQELVRAAAGTGEVNRSGELNDTSGLDASLSTELGDPTRALPGRVPVTLVNGTVYYVTPECDRAILAMQATNTILSGVSLNQPGAFVTSWKQAGHGNTNPDPTRLGSLGTVGGTQFFGVGGYEYVQYPYPPVRRFRPRPR